jgi:predicted MPP superfamily phosphohydrolase
VGTIGRVSAPRRSSVPALLARLLGFGLLAGALCVAYGVLIERTWYRVRRYRLAVLDPGAAPLRVLHLSDIHLHRREAKKVRFLASLASQAPDLTVITGDILGEPQALETAVHALHPVHGGLGSMFVMGSHDHYAPQRPRYRNYLTRRRSAHRAIPGRGPELVRRLEDDGWDHLHNRRTSVSMNGTRFEVLGMDDPHIFRHDIRSALRSDPDAFGLAVVHSPDPVPELVALGYRLIVAGHTHGGQVRMPVVGALITNSHVPREMAMGLLEVPPAILHVSPGLGTSRWAPFRFLCRPEATVLDLVPRA